MSLFVKKLRYGADLTEADAAAILSLGLPDRRFASRSDIVIAGAEPRWLPLILEGWACRYRLLENGKRQIISLFIPGDLCEPFGVLPGRMDSSIAAITPVVVAPLPLVAIRAAVQSSARIEEALWWDLLTATALEREQIVSLGRRSAVERVAHLFCELHARLAIVGLAARDGYDLPITQLDMSDLLGMTSVHINRSLQELRKLGFVSLGKRRLHIHDFEGLQDLALFERANLRPSRDVAYRSRYEGPRGVGVDGER